MIHILRYGFTFCGAWWLDHSKDAPQDKWVSWLDETRREVATCTLCVAKDVQLEMSELLNRSNRDEPPDEDWGSR